MWFVYPKGFSVMIFGIEINFDADIWARKGWGFTKWYNWVELGPLYIILDRRDWGLGKIRRNPKTDKFESLGIVWS